MRTFPRIQEEILFSKASGNWSTSNSFSSRTVCKQSACLHNVWWIPLICIGMKFTRSVERSAGLSLAGSLLPAVKAALHMHTMQWSVYGLNCAFICCVYIWCVCVCSQVCLYWRKFVDRPGKKQQCLCFGCNLHKERFCIFTELTAVFYVCIYMYCNFTCL